MSPLSASLDSIRIHRYVLRSLIASIEASRLAKQIDKIDDLERVCDFIKSVYLIDEDSARNILKIVDRASLLRKLVKEPRVKIRQQLIETVSSFDKDLASFLEGNKHRVVAVIPVHNEERVIRQIVGSAKDYADTVIVVDDYSYDQTAEFSKDAGAKVLRTRGYGYWESILTGLEEAIASGEDTIILDVFPSIDHVYLPRILVPILNGETDVVIDKRHSIRALDKKGLTVLARHLSGAIEYQEEYHKAPPYYAASFKELLYLRFVSSKILKVREVEAKYPAELKHISLRYFWEEQDSLFGENRELSKSALKRIFSLGDFILRFLEYRMTWIYLYHAIRLERAILKSVETKLARHALAFEV